MDAMTQARVKLAGTYLAIIMLMSIVFSFVIYEISERELSGQRQIPIPLDNRLRSFEEFDRMREARLDQGREHLRNRLIYFNLLTLVGGAMISYVLALQALRPIEENLDAQARFASDASHELKTPLTAMRSEIEVALRDKKLSTEEARQILKSNLEEITKLEALTDGLLQLARQENNLQNLGLIDIKNCVDTATTRVMVAAKTKNITIDASEVKAIKFEADEASITQLLVIMLDNAIKYSDKKQTVTISTKKSKNNLSIKISDNGHGIDPEDLPHIFDRFYRSDKARVRHGQTNGYGLGLAIAKQIVEIHGGNIQIVSTLGKGTNVIIDLPLTR